MSKQKVRDKNRKASVIHKDTGSSVGEDQPQREIRRIEMPTHKTSQGNTGTPDNSRLTNKQLEEIAREIAGYMNSGKDLHDAQLEYLSNRNAIKIIGRSYFVIKNIKAYNRVLEQLMQLRNYIDGN